MKTKNLKKVLFVVPMACAIVVGAGMLTACDKKAEFKANKNIATDTNTNISSLVENVYNNKALLQDLSKNEYTSIELNTLLGEEIPYYVEVGSLKNFGTVKSIEMNGTKFEKDEKVSVSVGNSQQITDNAYVVKNNKLYVAAPVIGFESSATSQLKINDKKYTLNLTPSTTEFDFTSVSFIGAQNSVVEEDGTYVAKIRTGKEMLGMYWEGATAEDVVLTRRYANGKLNGYGLTEVEKNVAGYPLGFYPAGYKDLADIKPSVDGKVWDYDVYVVGKGVASAKIKVELQALEVGTADELKAAIKSQCKAIKLTADINLPAWIERDLTIDLNGYTLSCDATDAYSTVATNKNANVVVKNGTLKRVLPSHAVINCVSVQDGSSLTLEDVTIVSDAMGVSTFQSGNATLKNCTVTAHWNAISTNNTLSEAPVGTITLEETTLESTNDTAVFLSNYNVFTATDSIIKGLTAMNVMMGDITLNNTTLEATSARNLYTATSVLSQGTNNGEDGSCIVIRANYYYDTVLKTNELKLNFTDVTFTSAANVDVTIYNLSSKAMHADQTEGRVDQVEVATTYLNTLEDVTVEVYTLTDNTLTKVEAAE